MRQRPRTELLDDDPHRTFQSRGGNVGFAALHNDRKWRGVGAIPKSGYRLRYEFRDHDAERLFEVEEIDTREPAVCISGQILKGIKKPHDCAAFGTFLVRAWRLAL